MGKEFSIMDLRKLWKILFSELMIYVEKIVLIFDFRFLPASLHPHFSFFSKITDATNIGFFKCL